VRRTYVAALERARLDEPARREFASLKQIYPEWRSDSVLVSIARALGPESPPPVAQF